MKTLLLLLLLPVLAIAQPTVLKHAHNDYEHPRPLWDALDQGFNSVEADVYLIDGVVYVYHDRPAQPDPARTLQKLYLDPLAARIKANRGKMYPGDAQPFFLMIDIKADGPAVYAALQQLLAPHRRWLTQFKGTRTKAGAVTIFLSGDRPIAQVLGEKVRWVALDGRPSDLGKGFTAAQFPVISDSYYNHLRWRGQGEMPAAEREKLQALAAKVHAEGKRLRLWATPEGPAAWQAWLDCGIDLINTDQLAELEQFLQSRKKG